MKSRDISRDKRSHRRIVRQELRNLSPEAREAGSMAIVGQLDEFMAGMCGGTVLLYAALPLEANVWEIIQKRPQFRYALPRVISDSDSLECHAFTNRGVDLLVGAFGIEEPRPEVCPSVELTELNLIIAPALALTPNGKRLGKGGGYYDRLLGDPDLSATIVAVGFDCQVFDDLPMEPHDQSVDVVITESHRWSPGIVDK